MKIEFTKSLVRYFSVFKNIPIIPVIIDEQIKVFTLFFRPIIFSKMTDFVKEVKTFENVQAKYHRYGGLEFQVNHKEFCHMHGDGLVDILLTRKIAQELVIHQICEEHHVHPETGWISYPITNETKENQLLLLAKCALELRLKKDVNNLVNQIIIQ